MNDTDNDSERSVKNGEDHQKGSHKDDLLEREEEGQQPLINLPKIIIVLIAVMALIHALRSFLSVEQDYWLIILGAFIPARFDTIDLSQIPGGQFAQIYSWVSYNFLHGDFQHLFLNSIWLVIFGSSIAKRLSTAAFILFFIFTSIAGAAVYMGMHWGEVIPVIGASAVVSGLLGGATRFMFNPGDENIIYSDNWITEVKVMSLAQTIMNKNVLFFVVLWVGINYLMGVGGIMGDGQNSIAWEAHLGGFFAGFLCYGLFEKAR